MSKQDKFYETLRQTQSNTFSDGLNMDLHPLTTPNTILTDCVNGTMITYNDNEFVLQNERGNSKIKISDTEHVKLSEGFIPVGMKEHNGILYIVSHNPQTKQSEIGTYPSPNKIQEHGVNLVFEGTGEIKSNYTDFNQNIKYYDYNTIVTNQDNYTFSSSHNPLVVLEHFILNKTGEVTKTKLIGKEGTETYRFTHEGEGTLGYRYRPYYLSSITPSIIPSKGGSEAQLIIEAISNDKELYEALKTQDDIKFKYDIVIEFVNGANKLEFNSASLDIDKWDYTFNLTNVSKLSLQFENKFTIENKDGKIECEYNYRTGELIANNTVDNTSTNYKEVNFYIIPRIYTSDDNYIIYDNLIANYKTTADVVFKQVSWFTTFKYKPQYEGSDKLSILATLDLSKFDIDWQTNVQTINEASFKLYEIDKYGNIKGKEVFKPILFTSPTYKIVTPGTTMDKYDLTISNDKIYQFKMTETSSLQSVQYGNEETHTCNDLKETNPAVFVKYEKKNDKTYNIVLLDANYKVVSTTNVWSENGCSNMIDERWNGGNTVDYVITEVPFEYNKVYLLELTFPINGKINKASFIIVTAQSMLNLYSEDILNQRMDEILLNKWFTPEVDIKYHTPIHSDYRNQSSFVNNLIDVERIKNMPTDNGESAKKYAMQFFLKYNQLFTNPNDDEIPAIGEQFECNATITNTSPFECIIDNGFTLQESTNEVKLTLENKIHLVVDESLSGYSDQTSERIYFYDQFYDKPTSIESLNVDRVISSYWGEDYEGYYLTNPDGNYLVKINYQNEELFGTVLMPNWLDSANTIGYKQDPFGMPWYYLIENSSNDYGATAQVIQKLGFNGLMQLGKVSTKNNITYSGNTEKIWIYCISQERKYILGSINLPTDGKTFQEIWECILKHAYYTKKVNKKVFQYVFKKVDDTTCLITKFTSKLDDVLCKIYPSHTMAIYNDYSEYNVQSWNNLNLYNIQNNIKVEINKFDNILWTDFNINYTWFLNTLGCLINNEKISKQLLNQYSDILQFDTNEKLYINNIIDINNYSKEFNTIKLPILQYDVNKNIIYTELFDNIDVFSGFNWKWNYSCEFNDFWNISKEDLNELNTYHSLLFYKLTTYNGEQQSSDKN